jgi:hypothetical protein
MLDTGWLGTGWAAISRALGLGLEAQDLNVRHTSLRALIVFVVSSWCPSD